MEPLEATEVYIGLQTTKERRLVHQSTIYVAEAVRRGMNWSHHNTGNTGTKPTSLGYPTPYLTPYLTLYILYNITMCMFGQEYIQCTLYTLGVEHRLLP